MKDWHNTHFCLPYFVQLVGNSEQDARNVIFNVITRNYIEIPLTKQIVKASVLVENTLALQFENDPHLILFDIQDDVVAMSMKIALPFKAFELKGLFFNQLLVINKTEDASQHKYYSLTLKGQEDSILKVGLKDYD